MTAPIATARFAMLTSAAVPPPPWLECWVRRIPALGARSAGPTPRWRPAVVAAERIQTNILHLCVALRQRCVGAGAVEPDAVSA